MASMDEAAAAMPSNEDATAAAPSDELPPALAAWYRAQGLEVTRIADLAPRYRYARVKDASDTDAIRDRLDAEPVAWLPGFLRMPAARRLKGSAPYEDRRVFAMDAASGFAARSLNCREGDRVLDLCCAPGAGLLPRRGRGCERCRRRRRRLREASQYSAQIIRCAPRP